MGIPFFINGRFVVSNVFPWETMKTKNENIDLRGLIFPPLLFLDGIVIFLSLTTKPSKRSRIVKTLRHFTSSAVLITASSEVVLNVL